MVCRTSTQGEGAWNGDNLYGKLNLREIMKIEHDAPARVIFFFGATVNSSVTALRLFHREGRARTFIWSYKGLYKQKLAPKRNDSSMNGCIILPRNACCLNLYFQLKKNCFKNDFTFRIVCWKFRFSRRILNFELQTYFSYQINANIVLQVHSNWRSTSVDLLIPKYPTNVAL